MGEFGFFVIFRTFDITGDDMCKLMTCESVYLVHVYRYKSIDVFDRSVDEIFVKVNFSTFRDIALVQ